MTLTALLGPCWVKLLSVHDRKDAYRGEKFVAEEPGFNLAEVPKGDWEPELEPRHANGHAAAEATTDEKFARPVDAALLERLRVPERHRSVLLGCRTFDELVNAAAPEPIKELVLDAVLDPDYDLVLRQPDLVTGDPSDLLRFAEGELLGFLLRLDPDQERFVDWALAGAGPTLVKGGPGTGKSTIALYRVQSIIKLLRKEGVASPRILFTTYTSALTAVSEQLLKRLLGEDAGLVEVRTADSVAYGIVAAHDGKRRILESKEVRALLNDAISSAQLEGNALVRRKQLATLDKLTSEYLLEEINSVIAARALGTLADYIAAPRNGRRVRLTEVQRGAVWQAAGFAGLTFMPTCAFRGARGVLRKNYRTTREIGEAAQAYLQGGVLDDEAIDRMYAQSDGPLPVMRTARSTSAELDLLARFVKVASREARQGLGACAVLVPSEAAGRAVATRLTEAGVPAAYMPGKELDLEKPIVKAITLQSAKGLEFPVVAVAGFMGGVPQAGGKGAEAEETEQALARQRRTMFVAMTRAMRALLVVSPDAPAPLFEGFDPRLWNVATPAGVR